MNALISLLRAGMRVILVGPPGCGKTARWQAAADSLNWELVTLRASLMERVDASGCLVPDAAAGVTRLLPLELLARLRGLKDTDRPVMLNLDDLGQAPVDVQSSLMRFFDSDFFPAGVHIVAATNRPGDKAGVTALCEPLRSRFDCAFSIPTPGSTEKADGSVMLGDWRGEVEGWCDWALNAGAPAEIIAWHRAGASGQASGFGAVPELYAWKPVSDPAVRMPDFRSWSTVIRLWNAGLRDLATIGSSIGKGQAAAFLSFASLADQLPAPDQVFIDPLGAPVPDSPAAQYLIASMLSGAVTGAQAGALCQYIDRMPRVMAALCARDAFRRLGAKLSGNKHWCAWYLKHQALFAV